MEEESINMNEQEDDDNFKQENKKAKESKTHETKRNQKKTANLEGENFKIMP